MSKLSKITIYEFWECGDKERPIYSLENNRARLRNTIELEVDKRLKAAIKDNIRKRKDYWDKLFEIRDSVQNIIERRDK